MRKLITLVAVALLSHGCTSVFQPRSYLMWRSLDSSDQLWMRETVSVIKCTALPGENSDTTITGFAFRVRGTGGAMLTILDSAIAFIEDSDGLGLVRLGVYPDIALTPADGALEGSWQCKLVPGETERIRWRVYITVVWSLRPGNATKLVHEYGFPKIESSDNWR